MSGEVRNWLPGEPGKYVTILDLKERWMKKQEDEKRKEKEREAREKVGERLDVLKIDGEKERVEAKRFGAGRWKSGGIGQVANRGRIESSGSKLEAVVEDDFRYGDVVKVEESKSSGGKQVAGLSSRIEDRRRGGRREWTGVRYGDLSRVSKLDKPEVGGGDVLLESKSGDFEYKKKELQVDDVKINGDVESSRIEDRRRGGRREWTSVRYGHLSRVQKLDKPEVGDGDVLLESKSGDFEYKKKELQVDDVKINGDVEMVSHNPKSAGWGKRIKHNGRHMKARVSEFTGSVNVVDEKSGLAQIEDASSKGDDQVAKTNCPYHSRSEHQRSGGFWVCKFIDPVSGAEIGKDGFVERNVQDTDGSKELKLFNKRRLPRNVGEDMTVDQVRKEAMPMSGEFLRMVNHDDAPRKTWQQQEKWGMAKGVTEEVIAEQLKAKDVAAEIDEHSKSSAAAEKRTNRSGKFWARGPVDGRKMYGNDRFKAERNFGSLTMEHLKKEATHVNHSQKKMINQVGSQQKNGGLTQKPENTKPMDCLSVEITDKSDAPAVSERVEDSSDKFSDMRNGFGARKTYGSGSFKTETNCSFLTGEQVMKEATLVNSDNSREVHQDALLRGKMKMNAGHEIVESVDFGSDGFDEFKTTEVTEWETNSRTTFKTRGNGYDGRKTHHYSRFNPERNYRDKIINNSKTFNGRMTEEKLERIGFMWVKKGEASENSVCSKD